MYYYFWVIIKKLDNLIKESYKVFSGSAQIQNGIEEIKKKITEEKLMDIKK